MTQEQAALLALLRSPDAANIRVGLEILKTTELVDRTEELSWRIEDVEDHLDDGGLFCSDVYDDTNGRTWGTFDVDITYQRRGAGLISLYFNWKP